MIDEFIAVKFNIPFNTKPKISSIEWNELSELIISIHDISKNYRLKLDKVVAYKVYPSSIHSDEEFDFIPDVSSSNCFTFSSTKSNWLEFFLTHSQYPSDFFDDICEIRIFSSEAQIHVLCGKNVDIEVL